MDPEAMRPVAEELYELYEVETGQFMEVYGFLAFCELLDPKMSPAQARLKFVEGAKAMDGKLSREGFVGFMLEHHKPFLASWATAGL